MKIAALDIGGTSIKAAEYNNGVLSEVKEFETHAERGGAHVIEKALEITGSFRGIDCIGISTAGQVDSQKGVIRYANENIPGYTGMKVKEIFEKEFKVPAAVENDVNAAALGEAWFGAGREEKDFLCLTYGTGVGGAVVIDREIYRGSSFSAGEFGAMIVRAGERRPGEDIFSGCYERYASATALVRKGAELDPALDSGRKIFARLEEEKVKSVVDAWILEVVYGLSTLIHIFNPSCVILGGGVMSQKYILDKIREILYNHIMKSYHNVVVKQAALENKAGILGAVKIAEKVWEKNHE